MSEHPTWPDLQQQRCNGMRQELIGTVPYGGCSVNQNVLPGVLLPPHMPGVPYMQAPIMPGMPYPYMMPQPVVQMGYPMQMPPSVMAQPAPFIPPTILPSSMPMRFPTAMAPMGVSPPAMNTMFQGIVSTPVPVASPSLATETEMPLPSGVPVCARRKDDPSTLSEPLGPNRARMIKLDLDIVVDFYNEQLVGRVDITCKPNSAGLCELVLDTDRLDIRNVQLVQQHPGPQPAKPVTRLPYCVDDAMMSSCLGTPLRVSLPPRMSEHDLVVVRVSYATARGSDCSALHWLQPEQTTSCKYPFLFSQCQAIHARSLLPLQDTCECKVTYTARVRYPAELTALMSAVRSLAQPQACPAPTDTVTNIRTPRGLSGEWVYMIFSQNVPVPPYLVALAVGEITSSGIGPRTTVWAEPGVIEKASWELQETEHLLSTAEELCGPYKWGIYDILVLPPSFPYGGMENPCLTFVTPTLLAGDRSEVSVIAHEIAHSWSGNLVTNHTWEHFFLNEGLTVFIETWIVNKVFGEEAASLRTENGWIHLKNAVDRIGCHHSYTALRPDLKDGADPDDAFSVVPYEKGRAFFTYLQEVCGGPSKFEPFLRSYFAHFAGRTVTSEEFRSFFVQTFEMDSTVAYRLDDIKWLDWFHTPGMPVYKPVVDPTPIEEVSRLAREWESAAEGSEELPKESSIEGWPSAKIVMLLCQLNDTKFKAGSKVKECCEAMADKKGYDLLSKNFEIKSAFLQLCLESKWEGAKAHAVEMAVSQGRMKYTRPLFRQLSAMDHALAAKTFEENKFRFHPICQKMIGRDLGLE